MTTHSKKRPSKRPSSTSKTSSSYKKRKPATKVTKSQSLVPFRENMNTGETYRPDARRTGRRRTPSKVIHRNHYDLLQTLDLEELTRPTEIMLMPESNLWAFLRGVIQYGLWVLLILILSTITAWYVNAKQTGDRVRMFGVDGKIIFQVGKADKYCRVYVDSKPMGGVLQVNGAPLLSKTPVSLLLPCGRSATLSMREAGYVPIAQVIKAQDQMHVRVAMNVGMSSFPDELKFHILTGAQPLLSAFGW